MIDAVFILILYLFNNLTFSFYLFTFICYQHDPENWRCRVRQPQARV